MTLGFLLISHTSLDTIFINDVEKDTSRKMKVNICQLLFSTVYSNLICENYQLFIKYELSGSFKTMIIQAPYNMLVLKNKTIKKSLFFIILALSLDSPCCRVSGINTMHLIISKYNLQVNASLQEYRREKSLKHRRRLRDEKAAAHLSQHGEFQGQIRTKHLVTSKNYKPPTEYSLSSPTLTAISEEAACSSSDDSDSPRVCKILIYQLFILLLQLHHPQVFKKHLA